MKLSIDTLLAVFLLFALAVIIIINHTDISLYLVVITGTGPRDDSRRASFQPHLDNVTAEWMNVYNCEWPIAAAARCRRSRTAGANVSPEL